MFPGTDVPILNSQAIVTVCPLGLLHMKKFSGDLTKFLSVMMDVKIVRGSSQAEIGKKLMAQLTPFIIENLFDLVLECCTFSEGVTIENLPHWDTPAIVDAWIDESFGEPKKWKPWMTLIDSTVSRVTGETFSLLETLSQLSSEPDTEEKTSSKSNNEGSATPAGQ